MFMKFWVISFSLFLFTIFAEEDEGCNQMPFPGFCISCIDGYYLRFSSCQRCPQECKTCQSRNTCLSCKDPFQLYLNRCYQCDVDGCIFCSQNNVCRTCGEGYYLNKTECSKCSDNCLMCDSVGKCVVCGIGYSLDSSYNCNPQSNSTYNQDQQQSKSSTIKELQVGLGIVVSVIVIVIITFISVRLFKKHLRNVNAQREFNLPAPNPNPNQQFVIPENPIPVALSSSILLKQRSPPGSQINNIRSRTYVKTSLDQTGRDICAICLSQGTDIRTSCTHQFHTQCLIVWCRKKYICPDCNNESFSLRVMCQKCKQFKESVRFCGSTCKENNHFDCFKKKNKYKMVCTKCE